MTTGSLALECMTRGWPPHTHACMDCGDPDAGAVTQAGLWSIVVNDDDDPLDGHDLMLCRRCLIEYATEVGGEVSL